MSARLPCGLSVWLARDRRLPLIEARLALRAGRVHEPPDEPGASQACEELLLKARGGEDAAAVARAYASLGWSIGASSEAEWLKIAASGLSRTLDGFLDQLARSLMEAAYLDGETALWRENAVEELAARRAQPHFLSEERLRAELFPGHPYGRGAADETAIAAMTPQRLRLFHAARVRPGGAHMVLAGDFDPEAVARRLETALGAWMPGVPVSEPPPLPEHGRARRALVDRPGSAQASIVLAQTAAMGPRDPDYMALVVANHVLGGTANSRLFENLRTRHAYTYGAYSSIELYGRGLVWSASADCRNDAADPALDEMLAELRRLRQEEMPAEALENARRHLRGLFLMRLSALDRIAGYLAAVVESGRDPVAVIAGYEARLQAVTQASTLTAASARLDPERLVAVIVGDAAALSTRR